MGVSVSTIARENSRFIEEQLEQIEMTLHPSVTEDEELVRRALFVVRNKSVIFERYISVYSLLYSSVQDVRPTEVTIDFRQEKVICTCPQNGWCRHKVSVILSLYQYTGSVQDWASRWRAKGNVNLHLLASERSPKNWVKMVDEVMAHLLHDGSQIDSYLISSIAENAHSKLKKHIPFEREWQPIFNLFMELAILNKLWDHLVKTNSQINSEYFEYFFDRKLNSMQNYMQEISGKSRLFATDPFFDALQIMVREMLLQRIGHIGRRLNLYLTFWNTIFIEKRRAEEELHILQSLLSNPNSNSNLSEDVPLQAVLNVFYILLKNYDELKMNLNTILPNQLDLYVGLAKFAFTHNDSIAGELILKAMMPHLNQFINQDLSPSYRQMYVRRVSSLYDNIDLTEHEEITLYSAFGTYGIQPYSNYLLKTKRYADWAALHQLYPSSISYLESCGLKEVLKEAPEVTLPLYHYYALEEVNQKTRMNYKQAVRIWKMMKTAAKKCGKTNFWTDYIHSVRENFKRLRALQEELEKGNLLV